MSTHTARIIGNQDGITIDISARALRQALGGAENEEIATLHRGISMLEAMLDAQREATADQRARADKAAAELTVARNAFDWHAEALRLSAALDAAEAESRRMCARTADEISRRLVLENRLDAVTKALSGG